MFWLNDNKAVGGGCGVGFKYKATEQNRADPNSEKNT